jgi:hypothetical protein
MRRHPLYSNTTNEQSSKLQTSLSTSIMSKSSKDGGKEKKVMKTKFNSIPEDDNERSSESEQDGSNTNTSHDNSIHLKN